MSMLRWAIPVFIAGAIVFGANTSSADQYPDKTIRIITSGIGGPSDVMARLIASGITGPLGEPVIVVNMVPIIAYDTVAKAPPDGYTIYLAGAYFTTLKLLQKNVTADPVKDFTPITETDQAPCILAVNPKLPAKSLKELIALAKAKPDELHFSTAPIGTAAYFGEKLLESMAGIKMVSVAYRTAQESNLAAVSGYTQLTMDVVPSLASYIKSGALRPLAVTSAQPSLLAPGLPTMSEAGLPGFDMMIIGGVYGPSNMPTPIVERLNTEITKFLHNPETEEKIRNLGTQIVGNSSSEFAAVIKADVKKWADLLREQGIAAQ